jgi:hypothetical protein
MRSRIGNAVLWLSIGVAGGWVWLNLDMGHDMTISLLLAAVVVFTGLGVDYLIAEIEG